jgi:hypothetical protein
MKNFCKKIRRRITLELKTKQPQEHQENDLKNTDFQRDGKSKSETLTQKSEPDL